jgi:Tfp pilus assembly protein PilP
MKRVTLNWQPLNVHQPWQWPQAFQYVLYGGASVLGVLLLSPWWLHSWQTLNEAQAAQATWLAQQEATQVLRLQTQQRLQTQLQPQLPLVNVAVLTQLAQQQGLQSAQLGIDKPAPNAAVNALQLQQLPVHLKVQGTWDGWLNWLAQWPNAAQGVTVSSLALKADSGGGVSAQLWAVLPQFTGVEAAFEPSHRNADGTAMADPFDVQSWALVQRGHAQQHASYMRWVVPELMRARDVLEAFPRERLQYVGHMASATGVEALVRVVPSTSTQKAAQMMSVYRVRVGQRLGQDFGKLLTVQPHQLVVQELAMSAQGEWQTREVHLPLHEASP